MARVAINNGDRGFIVRDALNANFAELYDGQRHVGFYGEIGGANTSPAIQAMVDDVGYFRFPAADMKIQDPITVPSSLTTLNSIDVTFSGEGKNKSILRANGMAGESMFKSRLNSGLYRWTMRDLTMLGDADVCIDWGDAAQLYGSIIENCTFISVGGPAVRILREFSSTLFRVDASSTTNHSFYIAGGNTTLLMNCYAHLCGDGFAGFRIPGHATLVECTGLDTPTGVTYWGWFGQDTTAIYDIEIVGGNAEDFGGAAILLEYSGKISIANLAMVARASGTFETYIKTTVGNVHNVSIRGNTGVVSKGATRTGLSNISGVGATVYVENNATSGVGNFPDMYNTTIPLLYELPYMAVRGDEFGKYSLAPSRIKSGRELGFVSPIPTTITASATTFSVASLNCVKTANAVATSLAQLTGGIDGQSVTLLINDANTTVKHNTGGAGKFILKSAGDETPASGAVYRFTVFNNQLVQV